MTVRGYGKWFKCGTQWCQLMLGPSSPPQARLSEVGWGGGSSNWQLKGKLALQQGRCPEGTAHPRNDTPAPTMCGFTPPGVGDSPHPALQRTPHFSQGWLQCPQHCWAIQSVWRREEIDKGQWSRQSAQGGAVEKRVEYGGAPWSQVTWASTQGDHHLESYGWPAAHPSSSWASHHNPETSSIHPSSHPFIYFVSTCL